MSTFRASREGILGVAWAQQQGGQATQALRGPGDSKSGTRSLRTNIDGKAWNVSFRPVQRFTMLSATAHDNGRVTRQFDAIFWLHCQVRARAFGPSTHPRPMRLTDLQIDSPSNPFSLNPLDHSIALSCRNQFDVSASIALFPRRTMMQIFVPSRSRLASFLGPCPKQPMLRGTHPPGRSAGLTLSRCFPSSAQLELEMGLCGR